MRIRCLFAVVVPCGLLATAPPVGAFEFWETGVVPVPETYTGEVWMPAAAESWKTTGNTVWGQCGKVIFSYDQPVTASALVRCEQEVASVNNRTTASLGHVDVGEVIVLPMTRWEVAEVQGETAEYVDLSVLEDQLAALRREYEASLEEVAANVEENATRIAAQEEGLESTSTQTQEHSTTLSEHASRLEELETRSSGESSTPLDLWALLALAVALLATVAVVGVIVWRNGEAKKSHKALRNDVHDLEGRVESLEEAEVFILEQGMEDRYYATGLTEVKLNDLHDGESVRLAVPAEPSRIQIEVVKRYGADGPYLELVGVARGQNILHPKRKDGQPWFRINQLFRKIKTAERNGDIMGIAETRAA